VVNSGLGRAHVSFAQQHYQDQFRPILGQTAWPGTLNVKVDGESLQRYRQLRVSAGIEAGVSSSQKSMKIRGFVRDGVSFGGATAFKASIHRDKKQIECAVLIPDLTRHEDVVEIICSVFLREALEVKDGDEVVVQLPVIDHDA
jgi:Transcriptional regulator of a riboflavin/FAD biosynthetic operon